MTSRLRVYDAYGVAKQMREVFADRPVEKKQRFDFPWPGRLQHVGDSLAVAYASDKWQPKDGRGQREVELYKHLAESRNRAFARAGIFFDRDAPSKRWPVRGPNVSFADVPMPSHFAILGLFEEIDLKLYTGGSDSAPRFGRGDDGVVHCKVSHAYLGGSCFMWNEVGAQKEERQKLLKNGTPADELPDYNEPFIFVYTKTEGVMFVVVGDELDIEKDGIVG